MGSCSSCFQWTTMFASQNSLVDIDLKAALERKLYIAKESPEPVFDLSDCRLEEVTSGIYSICKVYRKEQLLLNHNRLRSLDSGGKIVDLYLLNVLNISHNQFAELTDSIQYLVNLKELYAQNNQITSIPDTIQHLKCLQVFDISHNKLSYLTSSIGKLDSLKYINIKGNQELQQLCTDICLIVGLEEIDIDADNFTFPPSNVCMQGTNEIKRFLCKETNIEFVKPSNRNQDLSAPKTNYQVYDPFQKTNKLLFVEGERLEEIERKHYEANKIQREKFLCEVIQNQSEIDTEVAKIHQIKDLDRSRLIMSIIENEKNISCMVENYIKSSQLNPDVIRQQLQHEKNEHDHILAIIRENSKNIKKTDLVKMLHNILHENCFIEQKKEDHQYNLRNLKNQLLDADTELTDKIERLLQNKHKSHEAMVDQVLEDQDIQKALVTSLLEQVDARTWSINQEIIMASSNLATLTAIEQEKKKSKLIYNNNELTNQRLQLLNLIDDLLKQKSKRRLQLIDTIKEIENDNDNTVYFWLKNYQKILDSAPKHLLNAGKKVDPLLAHHLLEEGVIHCLPFLVKFLSSPESISNVSEDELLSSGVSLTADRKALLRAIENYSLDLIPFNSTSLLKSQGEQSNDSGEASALTPEESLILESECVVCMDCRSEVVFVPCGHLCCCKLCSDKNLHICPMCREIIERKIKVICV